MRAIDNILAVLSADDVALSAASLAEKTGRDRRAIDAAILRARNGSVRLLYIASWHVQRGHSGRPAPEFALGSLQDVPPPAPLAKAERDKRYREK